MPGSADDVHFVSNCAHSATINAALSVSNFYFGAGYAGTVTQNASSLTVSNALSISSAGILAMGTNNAAAGPVTLAGGGSITGTGILTGTSYAVQSGTISSIIAGSGAAMTKTTSGTVTLSAANTFGGGLVILAGTITTSSAATDVAAYGAGTITLGDGSGGSNAATLDVHIGNTKTFANPIVLAPATTGVLTISKSGTGGSPTFSGGITGSNNLAISNGSPFGFDLTFASSSINVAGTIANSGSGAASTIVTSVIGTNVAGVIENSSTSPLYLQGVNTFTGGAVVKSGILTGKTSNAAFGAGTITLGDSSGGSNAATLSDTGATLSISNPIILASTTSGVLSVTNDATHAFTLSGGVTGGNNLVISNVSTNASAITFSTNPINFSGTITNSGSGTSAPVAISSVIGSNVTGLIENASGSPLTLSGNNSTISGSVSVATGTLALSGTTALSVSGNWSNAGTFSAGSSTVTFSSGTHAVTGTSAFNNLSLSANNALTLPASATQTISGTLSCTGSAGNLITINSSSPGTQATLSKALGTVNCDYLSLTDSAAVGGATWNVGSHSVGATSDTSGWTGFIVPPGAPASLLATAADSQISLSWSAPGSNGGASIADYVVEYKLSATSTWSAFADGTSTSTSATVTGLSNGVSYDFRVSAANSAGQGSASATATATPVNALSAPTSAIAVPGNGRAIISFTAPASTGGFSITGYSVLSSPGGFSASGTSSPITVTGLSNGTSYAFTVTATNAGGASAASSPSNSVTPASVPGAPTSLSATPGDSQAILSWSAPGSNGGASIADYVVEYKLSATSTWSAFADGTSTSTSTTVTGLSNGVSYDFRVSAANSAGQGSVSATAMATVNRPAATYYWVGGTANSNISNAANWSTSAGACANNANLNIPSSADTVRFGSGCTRSASVDSSFSVKDFFIDAGYSGTVTLNAPLSASEALTISAGSLSLGTNNVTAGAVSLSAGTISGTTGVLSGSSYAVQSGTLTAIVGGGSAAMTKTTSGTVTLAAANTFSGGLNILAGTVTTMSNGTTQPAAFGAGTIALGDGSGGSAAATLDLHVSNGLAFANPIVLASTTTGVLTISKTGGGTPSFTGGITGNNNLMISNAGSTGFDLTFSGGAIDNAGTITNAGSGAATVFIASLIGSHVTGVVQNSAPSPLVLSGNNASFSAGVTVKSGTAIGKTSANAFGTGAITLGDSAGGSNDATIESINSLTFPNAIVLASSAAGRLTVMNDTSHAAAWGGGVTGSNSLIINNTGTGGNTLTFSGGSINNSGTVTNASTGSSGPVALASALGSNVTGLIQNSAGSVLTLSAANSAVGGNVAISSGTLALAGTAALSVAGDWSNSGTFAPNSSTVTFSSGTHHVTGATTFSNLSFAANNSITLPAGAAQTIGGTLSCSGTAGNLIAINSSSLGTQATLSKASGTVNCDYLSLTDSAAVGGATWNPGTHSADVSNNSGWTGFIAPPGAPAALSGTADDTRVSLSWTLPAPNGSPSITDYLIEYKLTASSTWSAFADGTSTATTASVSGLTNGLSYDFRVSAINSAGKGSPSSSASATPAVVSTPPVISSVASSNPTTGSVTITWTTDRLSTSQVEYGPSSYVASSTPDPALVSLHSVSLNGLSSGTAYHYRVISAPSLGSFSMSTDATFATRPAAVNSECSDGIDDNGDGAVDFADFGCYGPNGQESAADYGFSILKPSSDSRIVYVSSSSGNNSNDGLSSTTPKLTYAAGYALIRAGYPDWLLLKRGDTFSSATFFDFARSGRSVTEPSVLSSYGASAVRPIIKITAGNTDGIEAGPFSYNPSYFRNSAIKGLEVYSSGRDPDSPDFVGGTNAHGGTGIDLLLSADSILIEDNLVHSFSNNIDIQGYTGTSSNITLKRNIAFNSYNAAGAHSQGSYFDNINGLRLIENMYDHSGWNSLVSGADATNFNHGFYIQINNQNVLDRGNIITNSSSYGTMLRPGGVASENLYDMNPLGMTTGYTDPAGLYVPAYVNDNVFLESNDTSALLPRGYGINVSSYIPATVISNNIFSHDASAKPFGYAVYIPSAASNVAVAGNTVYSWRGNISDNGAGDTVSGNTIDGSGYLDPARTAATYNATQGGAPTLADFIANLKQQSAFSWRPSYAAKSVNNYIRAGFGIAAVSDASAPVISTVAAVSTTTGSALISWTTSEPSDAQVYYGLSAPLYASSTIYTAPLSTGHSQHIVGLVRGATYHYQARSYDEEGNLAASSDASFVAAGNIPSGPVVSAVSSSAATASSTVISWTTSTAADSQMYFGPSAALYRSSAIDPSLSTSHSIVVSRLPACFLFHYYVQSADSSLVTASSSDATFLTYGCTGSAAVSSSAAATLSGSGSLALAEISLRVPPSFSGTSTSATFQAKKLDPDAFFASAGVPAGRSKAGGAAFNLSAVTGATTTLSSFDSPLAVTLSYSPSDVSGLDPSSLAIYRYDAGAGWTELSGCSVDTVALAVSCQTSHFSDFSLFGTPSASVPAVSLARGSSHPAIIRLASTTAVSTDAGIQAMIVSLKPQIAARLVTKAGTPAVSASLNLCPAMALGYKGKCARILQAFLNSQDPSFVVAVSGPGSPGNETSLFGQGTKAALTRYQKAHGINPASGYFGPLTRAYAAVH